MTSNPALDVIRAARSWAWTPSVTEKLSELARAVEALNAEIEAKVVTEAQIPARLVCPGDQIKGRSGQWIEVLSVIPTPQLVAIKIKGTVVRKNPDDMLTVQRGPEGIAADMLGADAVLVVEES